MGIHNCFYPAWLVQFKCLICYCYHCYFYIVIHLNQYKSYQSTQSVTSARVWRVLPSSVTRVSSKNFDQKLNSSTTTVQTFISSLVVVVVVVESFHRRPRNQCPPADVCPAADQSVSTDSELHTHTHTQTTINTKRRDHSAQFLQHQTNCFQCLWWVVDSALILLILSYTTYKRRSSFCVETDRQTDRQTTRQHSNNTDSTAVGSALNILRLICDDCFQQLSFSFLTP